MVAALSSTRAVPKAASAWPSKACCTGGPLSFAPVWTSVVRRLQTRPQFQTVLAGPVLAKSLHFALHWQEARAGDLQAVFPRDCALCTGPLLGAVLPKRWARRAVTRNAIKRQIFAVAAQFESRLAHSAYVVRLRCAVDRARFVSASSDKLKAVLREELSGLFAQAVARIPAVHHA